MDIGWTRVEGLKTGQHEAVLIEIACKVGHPLKADNEVQENW